MHFKRQANRKWLSLAILLGAASAATPRIGLAQSTTDHYIGPSGSNWNTLGNWSPRVPIANDTVNIIESPTSLFTVTFDGSYTALNAIGGLTVDGSTTAGVALNQSTSGHDLYASFEIIGSNGQAQFNQSASTNSFGTLILGQNAGSSGQYSLSGGTLSVSGMEDICFLGSATFTQSAGTNSAGLGFSVGGGTGSNGTYSLSGSGSLTVNAGEFIGGSGVGTFLQTGGTNAMTGSLSVGGASTGKGTYTLSAGQVNVGQNAAVAGTDTASGTAGILNISGGTMSIAGALKIWNVTGSSVNLSGGTLSVASLDFSGNPSLFNWTGGTLSFSTPVSIDSNFILGRSISLGANKTLATSAALTNNGQLTLSGGALGGSGSLVNGTGQIAGFGTIGGSGGFLNSGNILQSGGDLTLSNAGPNANSGNIDLAVGNQLQLSGGNFANTGTINLNGATVAGPAQLTNNNGGVIAGRGAITAPLANSGTIALTDGTLTLPAFTNNGSISPGGITANISGGAVNNAQTIEGFGQINNNITNGSGGLISPLGGRLVLTGAVTNAAGGTISASAGTQLDLTQGLASNAGLISLTGGTLNTDSATLTNSSTISGYGVLRTAGLTNNSELELTGGTATINGPVTNNAGARVDVKYATAVFNSPVTNNAGATFKITGGSVAFVGTFTNNGVYASDPATNSFAQLTVSANGYLLGGQGDVFIVTGDFVNNSSRASDWNTAAAQLTLQGSPVHQLAVAGRDLGPTADGYTNNFSFGELMLASGESLVLEDGNTDPGGALYVKSLSLADGVGQISAITGNGFNIYYDPTASGNAYLGGLSYPLADGGEIAPTPEPSELWLLAAAVTIVLRPWRRAARVIGAVSDS